MSNDLLTLQVIVFLIIAIGIFSIIYVLLLPREILGPEEEAQYKKRFIEGDEDWRDEEGRTLDDV